MYYREVRESTPAELGLADFAAHIAGIAIERKQADHRIIYMAHHDTLTGLPTGHCCVTASGKAWRNRNALPSRLR